MCGFVACASEAGVQPGVIERGISSIRHRGPDGSGSWRSEDGRVGLGHARLAIIDLTQSGAQPMCSTDGQGVIAFNGEIYNYRELAPQVKVSLRSTSDTEVLLELLRQHGPSALTKLRGMFAFAYWDGEEILLARDRLGIKPLFYSATPDSIAAGSEIGSVLAMRPKSARSVDFRAIDDYLTYLYVPPPRTGIVGLRELPPGHLLRWRPGRGAIVERYWSIPAAPNGSARMSPEDLHTQIEDSVRAHLVADVPVGVFLSGGLDSSSLAVLAARHTSGRLRTFTVIFGSEGDYLDERQLARQIANHVGADHMEIPVDADAADILPRMVSHFGQPFGNPTSVLTYALSRETRKHVKVTLAGDGGDELLGGYPRYQGMQAVQMLQHVPARVRGLAEHLVGQANPAARARGTRLDRFRRFMAAASSPMETQYFRWVTYLTDEVKNEVLVDRAARLEMDPPRERYEFLADVRSQFATRGMPDAAPLVDMSSFLPCNVLAYGDRMSMAHALEVRVPFCDHLLAEHVAPLPLSRKMPGGVQKGLFRWAMRRDLPRRIVTHGKMGFNPPISDGLRGKLAPMVDELLGERSLRHRGLLEPSAVANLRSMFDAGHGEQGHAIWSLLVLEAWLRWLDTIG